MLKKKNKKERLILIDHQEATKSNLTPRSTFKLQGYIELGQSSCARLSHII